MNFSLKWPQTLGIYFLHKYTMPYTMYYWQRSAYTRRNWFSGSEVHQREVSDPPLIRSENIWSTHKEVYFAPDHMDSLLSYQNLLIIWAFFIIFMCLSKSCQIADISWANICGFVFKRIDKHHGRFQWSFRPQIDCTKRCKKWAHLKSLC